MVQLCVLYLLDWLKVPEQAIIGVTLGLGLVVHVRLA